MRASDRKLNTTLNKQIKNIFCQTISDIKEVETANQFLGDFLTVIEFEVLAKRLAIAYWLKKGRNYENIRENLKVSSATIASVQSQMDKEGFKLAIKNLEAEEWANVWSEKIKKWIR
jgi:TrpR-related protein YerC/YecD